MPSMEERMPAVERALRPQDRERAVQRQLSDVHARMDEHVTHADIAVLRDEMNQRMDAIQVDVSAILVRTAGSRRADGAPISARWLRKCFTGSRLSAARD